MTDSNDRLIENATRVIQLSRRTRDLGLTVGRYAELTEAIENMAGALDDHLAEECDAQVEQLLGPRPKYLRVLKGGRE